MKISLRQKRFLIVWACIHIFALIVNICNINGTLQESLSPQFHEEGQERVTESKAGVYLFTTGKHFERFWPFSSKFISQRDKISTPVFIGNSLNVTGEVTDFLGIFNNYDYPEFFVYILLGFALVFVPKLWNSKT